MRHQMISKFYSKVQQDPRHMRAGREAIHVGLNYSSPRITRSISSRRVRDAAAAAAIPIRLQGLMRPFFCVDFL